MPQTTLQSPRQQRRHGTAMQPPCLRSPPMHSADAQHLVMKRPVYTDDY